MNEFFKKNKHIFIYVIITLCIFFTGFGLGVYRCNRRISSGQSGEDLQRTNTELIERTTNLERELNERINEVNQYREQLGNISGNIDESIELSRQSGQIIESINKSVSGLNNTSSDIATTIQLIVDNQRRIRECVIELQDQNNELGKQLERVQECINK